MGSISHNILLPCLSLFNCTFFPKSESISGHCERTAVGVLIISLDAATRSSTSVNRSFRLRQNPLIEIRKVTYTISPDPSGEKMLNRRRWRRGRWPLHIRFFLGTGLPYALLWLQEIVRFKITTCSIRS